MGAIKELLEKFGDDTISIIRKNLATTGTNASGSMSKSLESEVKETRVIVKGDKFIYVVETGRKPGKEPPTGNIVKWLRSKPVSIDKKIEDVAKAISIVIAKEGTQLFQKGGRKDIITPALDEDRVEDLVDEIAGVTLEQTAKAITDGIRED